MNGCSQEENEEKEAKPQKSAGKKEEPKVRARHSSWKCHKRIGFRAAPVCRESSRSRHAPFPSFPFQRGKPARQPPSEDEEEEERSDDNDTMRVSSLLNFIHQNPTIFPRVYNRCLFVCLLTPPPLIVECRGRTCGRAEQRAGGKSLRQPE